jgi:O-antigen/teichoic acid export membrane protein
MTLYGSAFSGAYPPLLVLMGGRLVSAAFGSVGVVLITVGRENDLLAGVGVGAGVNIVLNFLLIPPFGAMGAATATAVSIVAWNVVMGALVRKRTGLTPGPLGARR